LTNGHNPIKISATGRVKVKGNKAFLAGSHQEDYISIEEIVSIFIGKNKYKNIFF
jgi:hypothetical protein